MDARPVSAAGGGLDGASPEELRSKKESSRDGWMWRGEPASSADISSSESGTELQHDGGPAEEEEEEEDELATDPQLLPTTDRTPLAASAPFI